MQRNLNSEEGLALNACSDSYQRRKTGNTDRHPENWGFYVDNHTNKYIALYPLMDFNQCFGAYDTIDGTICQTVLPRKMTQKEAALEAVRQVGLRQIAEIDMSWFEDMEYVKEMFLERLKVLREQAKEENIIKW